MKNKAVICIAIASVNIMSFFSNLLEEIFIIKKGIIINRGDLLRKEILRSHSLMAS